MKFLVKMSLVVLGLSSCKSRDFNNPTNVSQSGLSRPKQFVLLAFDGSQSLSFWQTSRDFAKANGIKFTYFISGVYYMTAANKGKYQAPQGGTGKSAIGFGSTNDDVIARIKQTNAAFTEGHEIASHANGHFDGKAWTVEQWDLELRQFADVVLNPSQYNGLSNAIPMAFTGAHMLGFRAPLLGHNPSLFQALAKYKYVYDTSKVSQARYWPEKINGLWNYPLASLKIAGSGKNTLSMDYNFYFAQSKGIADVANAAKYEEEMYNTYMTYFTANYEGNRAPVHIGHHFSLWNGGAYWKAMQRFAKSVCGLPEVVCGTYAELTRYLESTPADHRDLYRQGKFPKSAVKEASLAPWRAASQLYLDEDIDYSKLSREELHDLGLIPCDEHAHGEL